MLDQEHRLRSLILWLAFTAVYYGGAQVGLLLRVQFGDLSPLWPPSGMAVALLWCFGTRWWPVIVVGEVLTALTLKQPIAMGLAGAAAQCVEALLATHLLRWIQVSLKLDRPRHVFYFADFGVLIPPVAAATIGTVAMVLLSEISIGESPKAWMTWWLGDATGILLITPALVTWYTWPLKNRHQVLGLVGVTVLLAVVGGGLLAFGEERYLLLFFLLLPFMAYAAARYQMAGATTIAILLAILVFGLRLGHFQKSDFVMAVRIAFVGVSAFSGYLIAAAFAARRATREKLEFEKERALVTLRSIGEGVITTDADARITYVNPVAARLTGWAANGTAGLPIEKVLPLEDETTGTTREHPLRVCLREKKAQPYSDKFVLATRSGETMPVEISVSPLVRVQGVSEGAVVAFRDVTDERMLRAELAFQARHDALTGLFNRGAFEAELRRLTGSSSGTGPHGLLYLDLDQFKLINDTCGHEVGDRLLADLGQRLQLSVPAPNMFARLGGDEFGVLLINTNEIQALELAERLRKIITDYRCEYEEVTFRIGVSVGAYLFQPGVDSPGDVLSRADVACYLAKEEGRNRIRVYRAGDGMASQRHDEIHWIARLQDAIHNGKFELYEQRIFPLDPSHDCAARYFSEVLLRLHQNGSVLSPGEFLPAADRYGFTPALDRWVIEQVCLSLSMFPRPMTLLSINLSGTTLDDATFHEFVVGLRDKYQIELGQLCFEITEKATIGRLTGARDTMLKLSALGLKFALDDFGSGVASFGYLEELPVHYVKIDGRFVKELDTHAHNPIIVEALARIAKLRNLVCVAEWVETAEVSERLLALGIEWAQGFYLHRPEPMHNLLPMARAEDRVARMED